MKEIQLETQQYDYKDKNFQLRGEPVFRINVRGQRYYYQMINGYPLIFASATTCISDGYPEPSNQLEEWRIKMRVMGENPDEFANYRAAYGTIAHMLYGEILAGTKINIASLKSLIEDMEIKFMPDYQKQAILDNEVEELQRDCLAFMQWVKDFNVKPIVMELMIASKLHMVASAIDLICELDIEEKGFFGEVYKSGENKGKPKETKRVRRGIGVVDFKSGRKGFYQKHELQLHFYKEMLAEVYPELKIDKLYNWSPKDWRSAPTYNFKDQTDSNIVDELIEVLSLGKKRHLKKNKSLKLYDGNLDISTLNEFDYSNHYKTMDIEEYILKFVNKPKNPIEDIVKKHNIEDKRQFYSIMKTLSAADLKELAKSVGVKYTKKTEFVNKVTDKFSKEYEKVNTRTSKKTTV